MSKDITAYLDDVLESLGLIRDHVAALSRDEFTASRHMQDAVIRRIEVVGEAVKHIPTEFRAAHTEVPWRRVAAMRDRLIHGYGSVNLELTWETARRDVPELERQIARILTGIRGPESDSP